jgi:hypothetical protein
MIATLDDIRAELNTRNVIAFVTERRYAVNCVRTNRHEYAVLVTINGVVISEKVFVGMESLPRIKEINRLRKVFNCERAG